MQRIWRRVCSTLRVAAGVGFGAGVGLVGCASPMGSRVVELKEEQLAAVIEHSFPLKREVPGLFNVTAQAPRIKMLPESNRIATELELQMAEKTLGHQFQVGLSTSYGLRIDTSDNTVRLVNLKVDGIQWGKVPVMMQAPLTQVALQVVEDTFNDAVIYKIKSEDLGWIQHLGYKPGPITVQPHGLRLELIPHIN